MLSVPPTVKLWFASAVDLRLGFDGLAALVRTQLKGNGPAKHVVRQAGMQRVSAH